MNGFLINSVLTAMLLHPSIVQQIVFEDFLGCVRWRESKGGFQLRVIKNRAVPKEVKLFLAILGQGQSVQDE